MPNIKNLDDKEAINSMLQAFMPGSWQIKPFSKGNTNIVALIINGDKKFVMRIFGSQGIIDRAEEYRNIIFLSKHDLAPNIRYNFDYGLIQDYIPGVELKDDEMKIKKKEIAKRLRQWHNLKIKENNGMLFAVIEKWYKMCLNNYKEILDKFSIYEKINFYKEEIKKNNFEFKLGFCHNDLLSSNILKLADNSVFFIDYEYAGVNYVAFDIANHFAEYAGYEFNLENIPDKEKMNEFLFFYGNVNLLEEVLFFMPLTHLFWGLWALLRGEKYHVYGVLRLEEFVRLYKTKF